MSQLEFITEFEADHYPAAHCSSSNSGAEFCTVEDESSFSVTGGSFGLISIIGDEWDNRIETDIRGGLLADLAQEAISEFHAGATTPFPLDEE